MSLVRSSYLETARQAANLVADETVAAQWDEPGALDGMSVGATAAHLVSSGIGMVRACIDADEPPGTRALAPDRFFAGVSTDPDAEVHQGVRTNSGEQSSMGPAALAAQASALVDDLERCLPLERPDRRVQAVFGLDMHLDGFLVTRLVELVVHMDDLAAGAGVPLPPISDDAGELVVGCLTGVARRRHGDVEVMRALTRKERAQPGVLEIF